MRDDTHNTTAGRFAQLRAGAFLSAFLWLFFTARNTYLHHPKIAVVQGFATLSALFIAYLTTRWTTERQLHALAHGSFASIALILFGVTLLNGQTASTSPFLIAALIPAAAYIIHIRAAIVWTFASFVLVVIIHYVDDANLVEPEFTQGPNETMLAHITLQVVLLMLSMASRRAHDTYIADVQARERTILQQAEELTTARDKAVAASRMKSEFLATMSHEIRTPLNGVLGMTTLLLDTPLASEQREMIETVRASGDSLLVLLNDILDFSRIEAGRFLLNPSPFQLRLCVEDAMDVFAFTASSKGLDIAAVVDPEIADQRIGDAPRIRQMLVNLISNAVKFTDAGEIVLEVSAHPSEQSNSADILRFSVRDTGIGVAPDRLGAIFDAFTQADASTTRKYGGTGLGLAIVRKLAELMNGSVFSQSEPGRGSTFGFEIPLRHSEEARTAIGVSGEYDGNTMQDLAVLVVERHPATRRHIEATLRSWGATPTAVASADEVDLTNSLPRLAILDRAARESAALRTTLDRNGVRHISLASRGDATTSLAETDTISLTRPVRRVHLHDAIERVRDLMPASRPPMSPFKSLAGAPKLKILLAEDNPVNQRVAHMMLVRLGHQVSVVENGREALEAVRAARYDVVITDIHMPEMDGIEATRRIREEIPPAQQPRIVAMTASALDEDRRAYTEAGMDDFISKPIVITALASVLSQVPISQPNGNATPENADANANAKSTSANATPIPRPT